MNVHVEVTSSPRGQGVIILPQLAYTSIFHSRNKSHWESLPPTSKFHLRASGGVDYPSAQGVDSYLAWQGIAPFQQKKLLYVLFPRDLRMRLIPKYKCENDLIQHIENHELSLLALINEGNHFTLLFLAMLSNNNFIGSLASLMALVFS